MIDEIKMCKHIDEDVDVSGEGDIQHLDYWAPLNPQPCCNTCQYLAEPEPGYKRECVEPIVSKGAFYPRCPDKFYCRQYKPKVKE